MSSFPKGVFKTVADEVDFEAIDGVEDEVDGLFDDGEDVVEVVGGLFGDDAAGSGAAQDLSTWRVTIPSVAETPSGAFKKSELSRKRRWNVFCA